MAPAPAAISRGTVFRVTFRVILASAGSQLSGTRHSSRVPALGWLVAWKVPQSISARSRMLHSPLALAGLA